MKEAVYNNKVFIYFVVVYILFLLAKNAFKMVVMQDPFAAVVLLVQGVVLYQIYYKNRYVILGIKTWTFFPITKEATLLTIDLLYLISGGAENINMERSAQSAFFFLTAVLIFFLCDSYIEIVKRDVV